MKTHFHIDNKEFTEYFKITVNEKEYYFCDDLTVEYADCDGLNIDIELVKAEEYFKTTSKNSFLRLLLNIVKWILAPLLYFIDNEDGIRLDKGYKTFNPFTLKKSFTIESPNEKTININYIDAKYNKETKKYTSPSIELQSDGVIDKVEETRFSQTALKQEWNIYHIPAFTVIMLVVLLLNVLDFSIFAKVIREIPLNQMSENVVGIIGMSFCSFVMIALLIAYIVVIIKAYRLYKRVLEANL